MNSRIPHHKIVIVARASIISESEVFVTVLCLLCSTRYTAVRIKNCSKSTSVITGATMKNTMVACAPRIVWNWSIHCRLTCYTALRIKNCSKSTSVITVATMKSTIVPPAPVIIWNWSIHCSSLSAMFNSLLGLGNIEFVTCNYCMSYLLQLLQYSMQKLKAVKHNHIVIGYTLNCNVSMSAWFQ